MFSRYELLLSLVIISTRGIASSWASESLPSFTCPENEGSNPIQVPSDTLIKVQKTSLDFMDSTGGEGGGRRGTLCTLIRVTTDTENGKKYFAPVARSYDGSDWERVAGPYSASLEISCVANDSSYCQIHVPKADNNDDSATFQLVKYERTLSTKDEVARFFEQSTFGTKLEDINAAIASIDGEEHNGDTISYFSSWLREQIYTVKPTLHRSLWRNNIKSEADGPHREGITTHPCDPGAKWRSRAFDKNDVGKMMTIERQVNSGKYPLSIDGHIRTMVNGFNFDNMEISMDRMDLPASLELCMVSPHLGHR